MVTLCPWRVHLAVRRRACRTRAARALVRECAAWPLRGGQPSSVRHACGGPPVDDRGRNDRNGERRGRAARDCRRCGIRAPPGAVSVRRREKVTRAHRSYSRIRDRGLNSRAPRCRGRCRRCRACSIARGDSRSGSAV